MEAARSWGVRPTQFLEDWSPRDRSLALALAAYERSYDRGIPVETAWDEDSDGWLVAVPQINQVDAAIERAQQAAKTSEPGTRWMVVDTRVPGNEKYATD